MSAEAFQEELAAEYPLNGDQIAQYQRNGYIRSRDGDRRG